MTEPLCKYFNECGGCSLQHIDYNIQVENKKKNLINFIKFSKIDDIKVFSGNPYYYRNRMDMIFHKKGIGFRKKGK